MMKRIYLIRHAKAEALGSNMDYDRPLAHKGFDDANALGNYLCECYDTPMTIVSSAAKRTRQTADIIASQWNFPVAQIDYRFELYEDVLIQDFETLLKQLDLNSESLVLLGHNPWISYLGQQLAQDWLGILSTSACLVLDFMVSQWNDIELRSGILVEYKSFK